MDRGMADDRAATGIQHVHWALRHVSEPGKQKPLTTKYCCCQLPPLYAPSSASEPGTSHFWWHTLNCTGNHPQSLWFLNNGSVKEPPWIISIKGITFFPMDGTNPNLKSSKQMESVQWDHAQNTAGLSCFNKQPSRNKLQKLWASTGMLVNTGKLWVVTSIRAEQPSLFGLWGQHPSWSGAMSTAFYFPELWHLLKPPSCHTAEEGKVHFATTCSTSVVTI